MPHQFLKSPQILPVNARALVVDEEGKKEMELNSLVDAAGLLEPGGNQAKAWLPVHPVHKVQKLVLLGRQDGKGRQGGKQRIACIHAYLRLCSLRIRDLQKSG
jgi:hypothetical protein